MGEPVTTAQTVLAASDPATLARLLLDLGIAGVALARHQSDPGRLQHRPAVLPTGLEGRLRDHKPDLLALLAAGFTPGDREAEYIFLERLGIADDLHMPTEVGSPAWLVAVGEALLAPAPHSTAPDRVAAALPDSPLHFMAR